MFDSPHDLYCEPEFSQAVQLALANPAPSVGGSPDPETDKFDAIGARLVHVPAEKLAYGSGCDGSLDGVQG